MLRGLWRRARGVDQTPPVSELEAADEANQAAGRLVRTGRLVSLRAHVPANREAFQRWYADPEIAELLRHDQEPLNPSQSKSYFDSFVLPLSARGFCFAIHEVATDRLIGTTALTDVSQRRRRVRAAMFRIVIGEKELWGRGYGTEATRLVMEEAFDTHDLDEVRLEVFRHNPRAIAAYRRVGFRVTGEHVEPLGRDRSLDVVEMALDYDDFYGDEGEADEEDDDDSAGQHDGDDGDEMPARRSTALPAAGAAVAATTFRARLTPAERASRRARHLARRQRRQARRQMRHDRLTRRVARRKRRHAGAISPRDGITPAETT
jgi:RimJ/RimL family protein N-acetyltransferase